MIKKISYIFYFITIFCIFLLTVNVVNMDVLPLKYLYLYYGAMLFLIILMGAIVIFTKKKYLKFISILLNILISAFCIILILYVQKTNSFFDKISKLTETSSYLLIVNKDSKYEKVDDIKSLKTGINITSLESLNFVDDLKEKYKLEIIEYDNILTQTNDLLNDKISVMIINSSVKELLAEQIEDLDNKIRIIDEIAVEIEKEDPNQKENVNKKNNQADGTSFNIYISGIDTYGRISNVSRSDVNIIVTVNKETKKILITTIPRDCYVLLNGTNGPKDKLTHAGMYGINMSVATLEDLLSVDIDYYARINFSSFVKLINAVGGVTIDSEVAFCEYGYCYKKGPNTMNGNKALNYVRSRHPFADGDTTRAKHQEMLIKALIEKITSSTTILTKYGEILDSLSDCLQTSMPEDVIKSIVKEQIDTMPSWTIEMTAVEGRGTMSNHIYSIPGAELYVNIPYLESVNAVHDSIMNFIDGNEEGVIKPIYPNENGEGTQMK